MLARCLVVLFAAARGRGPLRWSPAWLLLLTGCAAGEHRVSVPLSQAPGGLDSPAPGATEITQQSGQVNIEAALRAELSLLRQEVGEQINGLAVKVDRSINNYDVWTLRLQTIGQWLPWLLIGIPFVTYIGPKLLWHATGRAGRRLRQRY